MKEITIFTPTYNRLYSMKRLYRSLINQTNKDFIWLIVDDGSTDKTEEYVREWINNNKIEIRYLYQKNQGKQVAHNLAVENCNTDFFICVDSDDYLTNNAVEIMISNKYKVRLKMLVVLVFLRWSRERQTNRYFILMIIC